MRVFIAILILGSFLQATIIPINLVAILILVRAYIKVEENNLYLAFFIGLLVSLLENTALGLVSLLYLFLVGAMQLFPKIPISKSLMTSMPFMIVILILNDVATSLIRGSSINIWPQIIFEGILILPIYIALRMWEERFVVRREVKLKV